MLRIRPFSRQRNHSGHRSGFLDLAEVQGYNAFVLVIWGVESSPSPVSAGERPVGTEGSKKRTIVAIHRTTIRTMPGPQRSHPTRAKRARE